MADFIQAQRFEEMPDESGRWRDLVCGKKPTMLTLGKSERCLLIPADQLDTYLAALRFRHGAPERATRDSLADTIPWREAERELRRSMKKLLARRDGKGRHR